MICKKFLPEEKHFENSGLEKILIMNVAIYPTRLHFEYGC